MSKSVGRFLALTRLAVRVSCSGVARSALFFLTISFTSLCSRVNQEFRQPSSFCRVDTRAIVGRFYPLIPQNQTYFLYLPYFNFNGSTPTDLILTNTQRFVPFSRASRGLRGKTPFIKKYFLYTRSSVIQLFHFRSPRNGKIAGTGAIGRKALVETEFCFCALCKRQNIGVSVEKSHLLD